MSITEFGSQVSQWGFSHQVLVFHQASVAPMSPDGNMKDVQLWRTFHGKSSISTWLQNDRVETPTLSEFFCSFCSFVAFFEKSILFFAKLQLFENGVFWYQRGWYPHGDSKQSMTKRLAEERLHRWYLRESRGNDGAIRCTKKSQMEAMSQKKGDKLVANW